MLGCDIGSGQCWDLGAGAGQLLVHCSMRVHYYKLESEHRPYEIVININCSK